ncbi:unnamed protein product, partial [Polarella glacialis]
AVTPDIGLVSRQLSALLESDQALLRHLRKEAIDLEAKLQSAQHEQALLRPKVEQERDDNEHLVGLGRQLERQILESKQQLQRPSEERRRLAEGCCSGAWEKEHASKELRLLEQVLEEELRALEETRRSNANLEESCLSLREDLEDMRRQREQVLEEAAEEARLLSLDASLRPPKKGESRASKAERAFDDDRSSHQPE